ncbi:MAG: ATP-binding cassette domain-containing protein [Candidatus Ornithospirochaeta sp.]|nr:ATP-binding cassette domain-containing protein [Sphaerochaetaceae bacterium]MDY5523942.1 ATP-binding cassette domain-containing protein [Candidatus Ornithospirochaeta sp.]MDY5701558.1 ATP-binding cassette domain-containing protein [Lachnospiraceae bacterium]
MAEREKLLEVDHIKVEFGKKNRPFVAVEDVSFDIYKGEIFGLVGESGSGKTTVGRSIVRANSLASGEIRLNGRKISGKLSKADDMQVTRDVQMIFQNPANSLNERANVGYIVAEGLYAAGRSYTKKQRQEMVEKALTDVGLMPEFAERFPHEFSGGQQQRIGIARALILNPSLIIADEPISALDVSVRAQVLNLLARLQKERELTYLFIAHDLSSVRFICDRIAVIRKGRILELAGSEQLFANPVHPYTKALLSAVPIPDPVDERNRNLLVYNPSEYNYDGDSPVWTEVEPGHFVYANRAELHAC